MTCTFTNRLLVGAILIHKTAKHADSDTGIIDLPGVAFSLNGGAVGSTDGDGLLCVDHLFFSNYTVHETTPAGYAAQPDQVVAVDNVAYCTDVPYVGETVDFVNDPLTNVTVTVESQIPGGTASIVDCGAGPVSTDANGNLTLPINDLVATAPAVTLTCTITVDP